MKLLGIDFTSSPQRRKPITLAVGWLEGNNLAIHHVNCLQSIHEFEEALASPGPWIAGIDLPFGLPAKLVCNLAWPRQWCEYVELVGQMTRQQFLDTIRDYSAQRPQGDRHHYRVTDRVARAGSPMMSRGLALAQMFQIGAPKILHSGVSIWPCHPSTDKRLVIEAYPALLARSLIGKTPYKQSRLDRRGASKDARRQITKLLRSRKTQREFGLCVSWEKTLDPLLVNDIHADLLDACLCAVHAGIAYQQGLPTEHADEGWIVLPVSESSNIDTA